MLVYIVEDFITDRPKSEIPQLMFSSIFLGVLKVISKTIVFMSISPQCSERVVTC